MPEQGRSTTQPSLRAGARREGERLAKFLVVGAVAFVVDTAALGGLVFLGVDRTVAKGTAFVLAVIASFLGNQFWAYRDSRSKPIGRQMLEFAGISLVGLGVNLSAFTVADRLLSPAIGSGLSLYVAHAAAVGSAMVWNFVANRLITYGDIDLGR
jgi:putative flippase GtrA